MNTENIEEAASLTNEQKIKVFTMYWGCSFLWDYPAHATRVDVIEPLNAFIEKYYDCGKLILTPLSAITDEDAVTLSKILNYHESAPPILTGKFWACKVMTGLCDKPSGVFDYVPNIFFAYQYLIQKGYAVPLFIAPNHPANGKTAIELNLAIDKTTLK